MRVLGGVDANGRGVSIGIERGLQGSADMASGYIDADGLMVVPGLIDLQVNGGFGHDFTTDPTTIWDVGERLPESGVTSFCPTIISAPEGAVEAAARALVSRPDGYVGAEPIGLHLEGPFLSESRRGTHPAQYLRPPGGYDLPLEHAAIVTIAPELPGALEAISTMSGRCVVSIGHSDATADIARRALDAGATMGTHLFNAMRQVTARDPGLAGVLLADERAHFGFVADGHHHDPAVTRFAWNAAPDRFVLVSDAVAAAGMPEGDYILGDVEVTLSGGAVRNRDGALAGAASLLDANLRSLMRTTGSSLGEVIKAATLNPSEAVRRWDLGRIRRGARGDLALFDGDRVAGTVVGGKVAYLADPARWITESHGRADGEVGADDA